MKEIYSMQKLMQILRLNDFEKIGNIIVTYQMDHRFLVCEYPVINTLMLVHKRIGIVQLLCMWLITVIAFDYSTTLLQISIYISWTAYSVVKLTITFPLWKQRCYMYKFNLKLNVINKFWLLSCLINMYQVFIFKFKVTVRLTKNVSIQDQHSQLF